MQTLEQIKSKWNNAEFIDEGNFQYYWIPSPNKSAGAGKARGIGLHLTGGNTSRDLEGPATVNWFMNSNSGVSADYVVFFDGTIICTVDRDNGFWSWSNGIDFSNYNFNQSSPQIAQIIKDNWGTNPNTYLVSIEVAGNSGDRYSDAQLESIGKIIRRESAYHGFAINEYTVIGHYQISPDIRANCPGAENVRLSIESANKITPVTPVTPPTPQVNPLQTEVDRLNSEVMYFKDRAVTLEQDKQRLQDTILSLKTQLSNVVIPADLSGEVEKLNAEITRLQQESSSFQAQLNGCLGEKKTLSEKLQSVSKHLLPAATASIILTYLLSPLNLPAEFNVALQGTIVYGINMLTVYLTDNKTKLIEVVE
jgi:hypothetical protein